MATVLTVEVHSERGKNQHGGDVVIETHGHRLRLAAYFGPPPGSHIGFWCTRADSLRGVNLRIGKRYVGPCLTLLAHIRSARPAM